jgi:periplasmic protein TonB
MNDRWLVSSFTASSLIHLSLVPVAALILHAKPLRPVTVPIELLDVPSVEQPNKVEVQPPPPVPKPKPQTITAPKLLSKPVLETTPLTPPGNTKEDIKPEEPVQELPKLASLPENPGATKAGWNVGTRASEAEGSAAGAGNLFGKGDGTGGGDGSGEALSGLARPLGGYQIKPRYPESARRAGVQGVTLLRVRVLENGRVGDVLVEQSAGFRDLDISAVDAVKKWLFEPARRGKDAVAVWVMLPVKFELH